MSKLDSAWLNALAAKGITTAYLLRLDFKSETLTAWTGGYAITPTASNDAALNGHTFSPIMDGIDYRVGENAYSLSGSNALDLTITLPLSLPNVFAQAEIDATEYLARPAYLWRALMISQAGLATPATWLFKRTRTGVMDSLIFNADGSQMNARLTIGSHASYISAASQSRYSDQKRFDPLDTSQDYQYTVQGIQPLPQATNYGVDVGQRFDY